MMKALTRLKGMMAPTQTQAWVVWWPWVRLASGWWIRPTWPLFVA